MKAAAPIVLPNVSERRHVHIINPNAGSKKYYSAAVSAIEKSGGKKQSKSGSRKKPLEKRGKGGVGGNKYVNHAKSKKKGRKKK